MDKKGSWWVVYLKCLGTLKPICLQSRIGQNAGLRVSFSREALGKNAVFPRWT